MLEPIIVYMRVWYGRRCVCAGGGVGQQTPIVMRPPDQREIESAIKIQTGVEYNHARERMMMTMMRMLVLTVKVYLLSLLLLSSPFESIDAHNNLVNDDESGQWRNTAVCEAIDRIEGSRTQKGIHSNKWEGMGGGVGRKDERETEKEGEKRRRREKRRKNGLEIWTMVVCVCGDANTCENVFEFACCVGMCVRDGERLVCVMDLSCKLLCPVACDTIRLAIVIAPLLGDGGIQRIIRIRILKEQLNRKANLWKNKQDKRRNANQRQANQATFRFLPFSLSLPSYLIDLQCR